MRGKALLHRLDPAAGLLRLLLIAPTIQAGHVEAVHTRDGAQDVGAARPLGAQAPDGPQALGQRLLALADVEDVEERRVWLGVVRARAAADDEQVVLAAVLRMQRDTCQVERLEHVRSHQLVGQRDADRIELGHGRAAFDGEQRQALGAHGVAELRRRQERALGHHAVHGVHHVHQDAQGLVCLPQLVGIRIHHAEAEIRLGLVHAAELMVQVTRRSFGAGKQRLEPRPQICHCYPLGNNVNVGKYGPAGPRPHRLPSGARPPWRPRRYRLRRPPLASRRRRSPYRALPKRTRRTSPP